MHRVKLARSGGIILVVAALTIILSVFFLLALSQCGIIAFTGGGWILNPYNLITGYLGHSILFFVPVLFGYLLFFVLLKTSLSRFQSDPTELDNVRFYSGGIEMFISLFFGIGVLFTAWGLQNALVSAIGGVSRAEAGQLGAWGILQRLVDNGILVALWTTIVGGVGGYLMRLAKHFFLGRELIRFSSRRMEQEKGNFFETLESIKLHLEQIEHQISPKAPILAPYNREAISRIAVSNRSDGVVE